MPQIDFSTVDSGILLLEVLLCLYLCFLPALLAFQRGNPRFWWILGLVVVLSFVQPPLLQMALPMGGMDRSPYLLVAISALYSAGPGWVVLLFWALKPVAAPDPRLIAFRGTKLADMLAALPLVIWFLFSALRLRPSLVNDGAAIAAGEAGLLVWLRFFSLLFSILFCLLSVLLLLLRDTPQRRIAGALPRVCAVAGTFLGVGILGLPVAELSLPVQALCFVLISLGSAGSVLVLLWLGKSFSIVPEARRLVTAGPYGLARHPLYAMEIVTILGLAIQYQQPWASLMGVGVIALQVTRSVFEERVLGETFPEYASYRTRVKRFGIV